MKYSKLIRLGVPDECVRTATQVVQQAAERQQLRGKALRTQLQKVCAAPQAFVTDELFGVLAKDILSQRASQPPEPISYRTWGQEIDKASHQQMRQACAVPLARGAALMPDAHIGYGLPIGGVLALEDAVIPYAVGVDIACRMKLSVLDLPATALSEHFHSLVDSLERGTRFGVGSTHERPQEHAVMDQDWTVSRVTRERKDRAWKQLGTSGSGNHFVEFGILTLPESELGLDAGEYLALLSHSGSRGAGAAVCKTYSSIARAKLPRKHRDFGRLAWLELKSQAGQEYWKAMNLMGDYAAANHDVIHRLVTQLLGATVVAQVENHHNFAWKERHGDRELIVHRKGATPAGRGVLGVIPGSMASPAFVVRGKGEPASFHSASHGAGRRMSRTRAKQTYNFKQIRNQLRDQGVHVISAGADEVPDVYKDIHEVMDEQRDLVETIARFDPRIVKMCGDGSRAED
jgi:tRNA-splicing ligase RtcB